MHSFQQCVDRFSLTGPTQKLKTLWKGQLSYDLLLSFLINSFKALFFKKIVPVQVNFYHWYFLSVTAYISSHILLCWSLDEEELHGNLEDNVVQSENKIS